MLVLLQGGILARNLTCFLINFGFFFFFRTLLASIQKHSVTFQYKKGTYKKDRDFSTWHAVTGQWAKILN